jgi:hypothetical protein
MEISLGYYAEVSLIFLQILKSPDIIVSLIHELKSLEIEGAREYHMKRLCRNIEYPIASRSFNEWMMFNKKQCEVIDDISMLNDPNFWQLHVTDWEGIVLEERYIPGYSYKDPCYRPWWRPIYRGRLQKLDLLHREYETIKNLWYKRQLHGDIFRVVFMIDYLDTDNGSDSVLEEWTLCS